VHGSETPEIHSCGQTKLLGCWLELTQQITPVHRSAAPIRKNQVFRFAILRPLPNGIENRPQDSEGIQRNAPMTSIGLSVVEFALIEAALRLQCGRDEFGRNDFAER